MRGEGRGKGERCGGRVKGLQEVKKYKEEDGRGGRTKRRGSRWKQEGRKDVGSQNGMRRKKRSRRKRKDLKTWGRSQTEEAKRKWSSWGEIKVRGEGGRVKRWKPKEVEQRGREGGVGWRLAKGGRWRLSLGRGNRR